jgi:predicted amidohydrolase
MLKLAVKQFAPLLKEKESNLTKILNFASSTEADIIIFPELATTGYFFLDKKETTSLAETKQGRTFSSLQNLSTKMNKIIVCGFIESSGEKIYNSAAIVFPDYELSEIYRKTHLFYKERFCFDPGDTGFFVINDKSRDLNLGTMICYDWRFPEAARTLGLKGADLIVCPSNLITNIWHLAMPARAIENKIYLAIANRVGTESRENENLIFNGKSAVYDYNGNAIALASDNIEEIIYAEIEPEKTRDKSFNEFNNIDRDRRPEMYEI